MRHQRGLALTDGLVALAISQLLLLAALGWLQGTLQLMRSQRIPAQLMETATWLHERLAQQVGLAGQGSQDPFGLLDARLSALRPRDGSGAGVPASDELVLTRWLVTREIDCEGNGVDPGRQLVERYFVRNDSAASGRVLACDGGSCQADGCRDLGDSGVALQGEIDSFQVHYGLRSEPTHGIRYVPAGDLLAAPPGTTVATVRIGLLVHARERISRPWPFRTPPDWPGQTLPATQSGQARAAWSWTLAVPHG